MWWIGIGYDGWSLQGECRKEGILFLENRKKKYWFLKWKIGYDNEERFKHFVGFVIHLFKSLSIRLLKTEVNIAEEKK
jgi:hypothetical protein